MTMKQKRQKVYWIELDFDFEEEMKKFTKKLKGFRL
jgi:hypothetical protein